MDFYQKKALRTRCMEDVHQNRMSELALGVVGEAGEVVDLVKKELFHGHKIDLLKLKEELGDVLWYLANIAAEYGINLSEVADFNIKKLENRYPNGFNKEDSTNRSF